MNLERSSCMIYDLVNLLKNVYNFQVYICGVPFVVDIKNHTNILDGIKEIYKEKYEIFQKQQLFQRRHNNKFKHFFNNKN